jgi:hypothetical protein
MSNPKHQYRWECVYRSDGPTIFLPAGIDRSNWHEVSTIGAQYAKFITADGQTIDCAKYARQAEQESAA